jgi:hypothetical protein
MQVSAAFLYAMPDNNPVLLLLVSTQAAKDVVLSEKPVIMDDTSSLEPLMLDKLLLQVGVESVCVRGDARAPPAINSVANEGCHVWKGM